MLKLQVQHTSKLTMSIFPLLLQASLQVLDEATAQLWWAGKEMHRGKFLKDFVGKNEKTKIIAKLQKWVVQVACASVCVHVCKTTAHCTHMCNWRSMFWLNCLYMYAYTCRCTWSLPCQGIDSVCFFGGFWLFQEFLSLVVDIHTRSSILHLLVDVVPTRLTIHVHLDVNCFRRYWKQLA